jgi:hypothetical protein
MKYTVLKSWQSDELKEAGVLDDQVIELDSASAVKYGGKKMRLVRFWDSIKNIEYEFLTNNFQWKATTVAALYKERWEIETFFKHLRAAAKGQQLCRHVRKCSPHTNLDGTDRHFALQVLPKTSKTPMEPVQSGELHPAEYLRED